MEAIGTASLADQRRLKKAYEKLACGKVNDAVRLIFQSDLSAEEMGKLDLTCISGIRKTKDTVEINFYDRLKALECLRALECGDGDKSPLYRALIESVAKTEGGSVNGV
jgi:hypothetical protein